MPEYYLFLYFEKNDKPLTVWELYEGVWKDFGWVDYRMSREYIEDTVENLSRWFVINDDGDELAVVFIAGLSYENFIMMSDGGFDFNFDF